MNGLVEELVEQAQPLIVRLLGGWRATAFAALAAVLGVALAATAMVQSHRLSKAHADNAKLTANVAVYRAAQTSNLATIDDLRQANRKWAAKCSLDPTAAKEAAAATEQANGALPADDQRRATDRGKLYEQDQSAAAWGRVRVPGSVASRLRK